MNPGSTTRCKQLWRHHRTCWRGCRSKRFRIALALLAALLHVGGTRSVSAQNPSPNEYAVKAAFLFHFAQFVDWPDGTFRETNSPLVYCTIGEDPFHGALEVSLVGKKMGAHSFQVRHARQTEDIQGCHVLFIGESEKAILPKLTATLKGNSILIVGESNRFVQDGGMIGFCFEENKIRFEINLESAEKAHLGISARLLALAKSVIGGPKRG